MAVHQNLVGQSSAFLETLERVSQVAPLSKPVLIIGERGTGKEMTVDRLHFLSSRWENVLVKLNCAALPETLLETELFGYEPGAFTGAGKRHAGRFERADGGTLFLDEIASMSLRLQEKLLRVVEYGEFERVGGDTTLAVDVRVIGAANVDLPAMAERGEFRADLLDRLSFDVITLPPLRFRRSDIPLLAEQFALGMTRELERTYFAGFSDSALEQMQSYAWPGNVRELKNVVERAVYRAGPDEQILTFEFNPFDSPWRPREAPSDNEGAVPLETAPEEPAETAETMPVEALPPDFKAHIQQYEQELLQRALEQNRYNQRQTARMLGLSYHQLRGYLKKYHFSGKQKPPHRAGAESG